MKKKTKNIITIATIMLIIIISFSSFYNIRNNGWKAFLDMDLIGIINLSLTVIIAGFIANSQTKSAKRKENFETIIEKFQANFINVVNKIASNNQEIQKQNILTIIRRSSNQLRIIKNYSKDYNINSKIEKTEEKLEEFHNILSDHIDGDIAKYENELNRITETIDNICEEIKLDIHN